METHGGPSSIAAWCNRMGLPPVARARTGPILYTFVAILPDLVSHFFLKRDLVKYWRVNTHYEIRTQHHATVARLSRCDRQ
jgi:hypothetical protein